MKDEKKKASGKSASVSSEPKKAAAAVRLKGGPCKAETVVIDFIQNNVLVIGFAAVTFLAVMLRCAFLKYESGDWYYFLSRWIKSLGEFDGLKGVGQEIGEYNVPYMLFLNIVAKTSWNDLYEVKWFSIFFDFIIAIAIDLIVFDKKERISMRSLLIYSLVILSPVSFIDSAYWGQCDGIYTAFLLLCFMLLFKEKYLGSMIMFGIALAFKLQAVFVLPVILIYYFAAKKMSIKYFLAIPVTYLVFVMPAIIAGRGFWATLKIYSTQTKLYKLLTVDCPNVYNIITGDYEMFRKMGIFFTLTVLGTAACYFIYHKIEDKSAYLMLAFWSTFVCVYFLPGMHDRYIYLACFFGIAYSALTGREVLITLGVNVVGLLGWIKYLFHITTLKHEYLAIVNFILLFILTVKLFRVADKTDEQKKLTIEI